jgi:hypothetical protein
MEGSSDPPRCFKDLIDKHDLFDACNKVHNVLNFAHNNPDGEIVKALIAGENQDLETVAAAASILIEFVGALMRAKQNAIQAFENPLRLLNPNKFPLLLAEVSVS